MDSINLRGQRALVTGASSGIGAACALALGRAGAAVAVNYLDQKDAAERMCARLHDAGARAIPLEGDVSSEQDIERMFRAAVREFGGIDILIGNAGIEKRAMIADMSLDDWSRVIAVNLTGQFLCARAAVRQFCKQGVDAARSAAAGKIVFTSSVHDIIPWARSANYAASKGGLDMLMRSLAQEVAGNKIRVNCVSPGAIRTHINRAAWDTEEARRKLLELIPYGRIGEPDDVAHVAAWLASDLADYITGTTIYVDGGMTLYPAFEHGG